MTQSLSDLLGGGGSSGGGGGAVPGQLIETSEFYPTFADHLKGTQKHTLSQAVYPELFSQVGLVADNAFKFSDSSTTSPGADVDDAGTNLFDLVTGAGATATDAEALIHAEGDTWFLRRNSTLHISTTGSEGPFTECTGFSENEVGHHYTGIAYGNGYLVCLGRDVVVCNTVANDFTAWTEYNMDNNASRRMHQVIFAKGHFFILWSENGDSGGSFTLSWTDDPRFESNYTDWNTGFTHWSTVWNPTDCHYWLDYFPDEDKIVLFMVDNWTAQDRHYFEIWWCDDPANDVAFTENTEHNALWSYVSSNDNTLDFGLAFEQNGAIVALLDIQGSPRAFIWNDITVAPTRVVNYGNNLAVVSFHNRSSIMRIPQLLPNGGVLQAYNGTVYRYSYDGIDLIHQRSDQLDFIYDNVRTSFNNQSSSRAWAYDESNGYIVTYMTPDAVNTTDLYRWAWPIYTYDTVTEFALMPSPHPDPEIIYQTRTA